MFYTQNHTSRPTHLWDQTQLLEPATLNSHAVSDKAILAKYAAQCSSFSSIPPVMMRCVCGPCELHSGHAPVEGVYCSELCQWQRLRCSRSTIGSVL